MAMKKQKAILCVLLPVLRWSNANRVEHIHSPNQRDGHVNNLTPRNNRNLQSATIQGACKSSSMSPGNLLKATESILCHPMPSSTASPIYKFGIDSSNTLSYYVYDTAIWRAVPSSSTESTACIVFGNCDASMVFFRLQNGGSLVAYDGDTTKVWDSHENIEENGEYVVPEGGVFGGDGNTDYVSEKVPGSVLFLNEEGVFIESPGEEVTWRLFAPDWEAPSKSPVEAPSKSPVVVTTDPTGSPTTRAPVSASPTANPTVLETDNVATGNFVGISGMVFEDGIDQSSIIANIVVDLYDCPESSDPKWIVMTRTNETGHYVLKDDSSSSDLSTLLANMNITKFRAMFGGLPTGYAFSPAVSGSDVNADGQTSCWDLRVNGDGSIVWDAGVIRVDTSTNVPTPTSPPTVSTNKPTQLYSLIGGYAFFDADNNGLRASNSSIEPVMTNIDVELFSCGSTATNVNDDVKLAADKTNAEGMYVFRNVTSGYYRVKAEAPQGYVYSSIWSGNTENGVLTHPNADSTVNPRTGSTPCFPIVKGDTDLSWSFGLTYDDTSPPIIVPSTPPAVFEEPTSSPIVSEGAILNSTIIISGLVFYDKNENGYFEKSDEETISSVDVAIFDCDGAIIFVGSTDENGLYGFDNLRQASYQVKFSLPTGYQFSNVWSGEVDKEGEFISSDADSDVDPETGLSTCREYSDSVYSLDAGMILLKDADTPTAKPITNPNGDGTPCSGGRCPEEGMCRNVAGVCGSGLSFCNPQSVWTPDCGGDNSKSPTISPATIVPTTSFRPSFSSAPSDSPSVATMSVCNKNGSYGKTTSNTQGDDNGVREQGVLFTYSLLNEGDQSFEDAVAQFEEELNLRLACIYFDDPCLECSTVRKTKNRRLAVEGSDVVGMSSAPPDSQNPTEACALPNYNCRVMTGLMTSYFPADILLSKVIADTNQMLKIISDMMASTDWTGVAVSYNNEPIPLDSVVKEPGEGNNDGGFPAGAVVGIVFAALAALVALVALVVFFLKEKRDKEREHTQARAIPYGDDSNGSQVFDEDDSDSDSSSSEEDDMSGVISGPSFVSGGDYSFPTTMARANPSDVEQDSSSDSDTSSDSDDEEAGEYEIEENENNVDTLKTSASSDEAPPVYEQDDMADYSHEQPYSDQYDEQFAHEDQQNYDMHDRQFQEPMLFGQMRNAEESSNGSGGSMGSMNSADPPGRSFRDLHQQEDGWNGMLPPPQSMATNNVNESGFFVDEYSHDVYENDDVSHPDSYHSNASHHSNHSNKSNRSKSRERSKSRDRNQASYHSFYNDEDYIGDINQDFDDSRGSDQGYTGKDQPTQHVDQFDYDQQSYNYQDYHHQDYHNAQYDQEYNSTQSPQYEQDDFHNQSYQQYEEIEHDYKDDTTTFSDATRQISNVNPAPDMHSVEQLSEANSERSYEEEEESISNIFKSLSEIQTKLAKKGKTSSKEKGRIPSASSNTSDGVVEDVSVDGSQMSSFEAKAAKNRRPSAGNWMEPVDEYES